MTDASSPNTGAKPCPTCGEPASGRFCSNCGTPLGGIACGACGAELAAGAKFCHACGTPVAMPGAVAQPAVPGAPAPVAGQPTAKSGNDALPWAVAAIAFLALIAMFAGQKFAHSGSSGAGAEQSAMGAQSAEMPTGPAPDISNMSPEERASKLYDRMMGAFEAGHMDTVQMFAPMATAAYQMLPTMTTDDRYDLGQIGEMTGDYALATAEADTILNKNPNHLLGLILAAQSARAQNDSAAAKKYLARLLKVAPAEQAKKLPEYQKHENDIKEALSQARKG